MEWTRLRLRLRLRLDNKLQGLVAWTTVMGVNSWLVSHRLKVATHPFPLPKRKWNLRFNSQSPPVDRSQPPPLSLDNN